MGIHGGLVYSSHWDLQWYIFRWDYTALYCSHGDTMKKGGGGGGGGRDGDGRANRDRYRHFLTGSTGKIENQYRLEGHEECS